MGEVRNLVCTSSIPLKCENYDQKGLFNHSASFTKNCFFNRNTSPIPLERAALKILDLGRFKTALGQF